MQTASEQKNRIFAFMQTNGPSLPVQVARTVELSPLFASAFLSELYREKKIKISNLRVGSSPLYFVPGQEEQLEKFVEHLNSREREAFILVKEKKILEDEKQTPVIRVALRAIGDFAVPVKANLSDKETLLWKYHLLSDDEFSSLIKKHQMPPQVKREPEVVRHEKKIIRAVKDETAQISELARSYITNKNLVLISVVLEKKREFHARVHTNSMFGPQHYYLVAKDKKKVSSADIKSVIDAAQKERMPAVFLCPGDPDKRAQAMLNEWSNLIKFEKIV